MTFLKTFINDEDGAVTVDWVVLTASVVALGIFAMSVMENAVAHSAGSVGNRLTAMSTDLSAEE